MHQPESSALSSQSCFFRRSQPLKADGPVADDPALRVLDFNSTVIAHVENLVRLQSLELERTRLAQIARALPVEITQAEAALGKAQQASADASAALDHEETLRARLERDAAAHRQKAARYRAQLDTVTTPAQAQAMEHEIAFAQGEIERLENEELESLERTDGHEAALAESRRQVELLDAALGKTRELIALRQREIAGQQDDLCAQRHALRATLDEDWLARFDRLAAHRGTAMSRAENQQCSACRMGVRPQIWNQVREGELIPCDSCGRLLYYDPNMAKPPETESALEARNVAPPAIPRPRRVV